MERGKERGGERGKEGEGGQREKGRKTHNANTLNMFLQYNQLLRPVLTNTFSNIHEEDSKIFSKYSTLGDYIERSQHVLPRSASISSKPLPNVNLKQPHA